MDSYEIIITPDAESDLIEIRDYIAYTLLVPEVALNYKLHSCNSQRNTKVDVYGFKHYSHKT